MFDGVKTDFHRFPPKFPVISTEFHRFIPREIFRANPGEFFSKIVPLLAGKFLGAAKGLIDFLQNHSGVAFSVDVRYRPDFLVVDDP